VVLAGYLGWITAAVAWTLRGAVCPRRCPLVLLTGHRIVSREPCTARGA
jgi:hypothetical protein